MLYKKIYALLEYFYYLRDRIINPKFTTMKNDKNLKKPFFANFLESQVSENELKKVNGGTDAVTLKFPSDGEDGPGGGGVIITSTLKDTLHTMKYPSDSDEAGTEV